ncbi:OpgC domain-containing protein [Mycobacterium sp. WMMD1722]|uniref:OpgC domain-containing protein n=1 Tax=Mycobacterium sp. WMMD1722 TaxID=3404117 RepID=UPI003BF4B7FB
MLTRDEAIDAVRGLCIFSMVIGHISFGSTLWGIVHPVPWIDGASGFVLLAGLVVGMVSRRRADVAGVAWSQLRLARRIVLLYLSQFALTALAVVVSLTTTRPDAGLLDAGQVPPARVVWWLATMQINPDHIDILSMYVVLQVLAMLWIALSSRRCRLLAVVSSTALYTAALALNWGRLPNRPDGWAFFNTAGWQALFGIAFAVGWYWSALRDPLRGRVALAVACVGGLAVATAGVIVHHVGAGGWLFDKASCGPARIALALAAFVVLYQLMRFVHARAPALVGPVALVGSRSLACFIALSVVDVLLPVMIGDHPTSPAAQIAAVLTMVLMYPVARARRAVGMAVTR